MALYKSQHLGTWDTCFTLRALVIILAVFLFGAYTSFYLMTARDLFGGSTDSERDNELLRDGTLDHEEILLHKKIKSSFQDRKEVRRKRFVEGSTTSYFTTYNSPETDADTTFPSSGEVSSSEQSASTVNTPASFTQVSKTSTSPEKIPSTTQTSTETKVPKVSYKTPTTTRSTTQKSSVSDDPNGTNVPKVSYKMPTTTPSTTQKNSASDGSDRLQDASPQVPTGNSPPTNTLITEPPATWKPNPTIYTSPHIQKIAEEFLNSVTWHTTAEAGEMSKSSAPSTASSPYQGAKSSSQQETATTQNSPTPSPPTKPLYTSYNIPTARPLPPVCLRESFKLNRVCNLTEKQTAVKGNNVTLEDIAQMIFAKSTLKVLTDECEPSEWCLSHNPGINRLQDDYTYFCDVESCLLEMPDECLNEERKLILSTLFLMCRGRSENLTEACLLSISKMTHVAMTDIYRTRFRRHQSVCQDPSDKESCTGPCSNNARNLFCMSVLCNTSAQMFTAFSKWTWFFNKNETSLQKCNVTDNECEMFETELTAQSWWTAIWQVGAYFDTLTALDYRLVVGIVSALLAIMAGMSRNNVTSRDLVKQV